MKTILNNIRSYVVYYYILITNSRVSLRTLYSKMSFQHQMVFFDSNQLVTQSPPYIVANNKWGEYKLKSKEKYQQNLYKLDNTIGWNFSTQNPNRGVIGFPEIFLGKSPFGGESTSPRFPQSIDQIKKLEATYDVSMYIEPKKYNLVFDMWVTSNPQSTVKDIVHEIMIWEDRNIARPFGKYLKTLQTPFGSYKVYSGWMDRSSENFGTPGWMFTAFVKKGSTRKATIDVKYLLDYMITKNMVDSKHYLSTVEFGTEVYNSNGYVIVNDYNLKIQ